MEWDLQTIIFAIFGGTSVTGLLTKGWQLYREHNADKLDREDTAIAKWQAYAEEREEQAHAMEWELNWYRAHYAAIRAEWLTIPPEDASIFPPIPPPPTQQN